MSKLGIATAIAVAALIATTVAAPAQIAPKRAAHARSNAFDGLWSVSILTQAGPCNVSYRYPARIMGGRVTQADNNFSYQISGAVVASGSILVTVSQNGQSATGYGRLRGSSGGGRWTASGNQCYGTWSALRRAAY